MGAKDQAFKWVLSDFSNDLPRFSDDFRSYCEEQGLDDGKIFELELSMEELIVNSFTHGYPDGEEGTVVVEAEDIGTDLRICMRDQAPPFDLFRDAPDPWLGGKDPGPKKEEKEGGLGIHLVKSLNDRVEYYGSKDGNEVVIIKSKL